MANYIIKRVNKKRTIIEQEKKVISLIMNPKLKNHENLLEISSLEIINPEIKKNICYAKFDRLFRRLASIIISFDDGEAEDGDFIIALNEIEKAKMQVLDEYNNFLGKEEIKKMLQKLDFLEKEFNQKVLMYNLQINNNLIDDKVKGKGR